MPPPFRDAIRGRPGGGDSIPKVGRRPTEPFEDQATRSPASWRPLVQRVRKGLEEHRRSSAGAVEVLLAAVDRTLAGLPRGQGPALGSARAERQRASIRLVEAALGLRLLEIGCTLRVEVLGPRGRRCDFLAARGDHTLAIHVKQMPAAPPSRTFDGRERAFESITRPVAVALRRRPMTDDRWRRLLPELRRFLELASVGEEQRHLDARGREVLSARILGPVPGERLRLIPVGGGELDAGIARFRRLLERAHGQFLSEHPNLILFGSVVERPAAASLYALEAALLGTQVERWDRFPRKGHRVAHGRADDGFWHGRRHERSGFAGWFAAAAPEPQRPGGWWDRDALLEAPRVDRDTPAEATSPDDVRSWLTALLGPAQQALGT